MATTHLPFRIFLTSCFLLVAGVEAFAGQAAGEAHGAIVWKLPAGATTEAGSSLAPKPVFRGRIDSVEESTLAVAGSPFVAGALVLPAEPHALRLTSGRQKGRLFRIVHNTVNTVTVDSTGLGLDSAALKVEAKDRFEIVPLATLGSRFGRTAATVRIQAGATEAGADLLQVWNGSAWDSYFFSTGVTPARWVPAANPVADANDLALPPDAATRVVRRGSAKDLVLSGRVPPVRLLFRAVEGTEAALGAPFPVSWPVTEISIGGPAVWGKSTVPATADKVRLRHAGSELSIFQDTSGVWRNVAAPSAGLSGVSLQPSGLAWVQNIGAASPIPWFTLNPPYPDQVGPVEPPAITPVPPAPPKKPPTLRVTTGRTRTTRSKSLAIRGTAASSQVQIRRIEYRRHPSKSYRRASGTRSWKFKAPLKKGKNVFYVRAIDTRGLASPTIKVTLTRK